MDRPKLIQLVHVAKGKLGLSEERYLAVLEGTTGKASCSELSPAELMQVLDAMKGLGFRFRAGKRNPVRPGDVSGSKMMASERQVYYMKGLFDLACRAKDERALRALLKRQTGVEDFRWCPKAKVPAVVLMLKDIARKAGFDPDRPPGRETK